jgi:hypothetical protein
VTVGVRFILVLLQDPAEHVDDDRSDHPAVIIDQSGFRQHGLQPFRSGLETAARFVSEDDSGVESRERADFTVNVSLMDPRQTQLFQHVVVVGPQSQQHTDALYRLIVQLIQKVADGGDTFR